MPKPINYLLGYANSQVIDIACGAYHSVCVISSSEKSVFEEDSKLAKRLISLFSNKWA